MYSAGCLAVSGIKEPNDFKETIWITLSMIWVVAAIVGEFNAETCPIVG